MNGFNLQVFENVLNHRKRRLYPGIDVSFKTGKSLIINAIVKFDSVLILFYAEFFDKIILFLNVLCFSVDLCGFGLFMFLLDIHFG